MPDRIAWSYCNIMLPTLNPVKKKKKKFLTVPLVNLFITETFQVELQVEIMIILRVFF